MSDKRKLKKLRFFLEGWMHDIDKHIQKLESIDKHRASYVLDYARDLRVRIKQEIRNIDEMLKYE